MYDTYILALWNYQLLIIILKRFVSIHSQIIRTIKAFVQVVVRLSTLVEFDRNQY